MVTTANGPGTTVLRWAHRSDRGLRHRRDGGIGEALDLLERPIRAELRRRVHMTSVDQVEIVSAELGTWAWAIGAAIHGAETPDRTAGVVIPAGVDQ